MHVRNSIVPKDGQTRICLDPWDKVFIRATGEVCLCCNSGPVGSLEKDTLDDILNNDKSKEYRLGLLTGNIMPDCATCPDRPSGSTEQQLKLVKQYLGSADDDILI